MTDNFRSTIDGLRLKTRRWINRQSSIVNRKFLVACMLIIALGSMTPFPFDLIGIAAGLMKYDPRKFFVAAMVGKWVRYILIAFAGSFGIAIIKSWFLIP